MMYCSFCLISLSLRLSPQVLSNCSRKDREGEHQEVVENALSAVKETEEEFAEKREERPERALQVEKDQTTEMEREEERVEGELDEQGLQKQEDVDGTKEVSCTFLRGAQK